MLSSALAANHALPGDLVQLDGRRVQRVVERAPHTGLVGVLELANPTRYGFTSRGAPIYLFTPWDEAYPHFYVGSSARDTSRNVLAVVNFVSWDSGNLPRGDLREILGPCGDLAAEEKALWLSAGKPWTRHPALAPPVGRPPLLATGTTFHIDPPDCRDIDDAVTLMPLGAGAWSVHIHIADVASLVQANPWLTAAADRGQTFYDDGKIIRSMLPAEAERACSLLPGEERQTLTLAYTWSAATGATDFRWLQERVVVRESYTYESIVGTTWAPVLEAMAGTPDPHKWVEHLMLLYNREAAAVLRQAGFGILRRHGAPDMEALERLAGIQGVPEHLAFSAGEYCPATATDVAHWGLGAAVYCHASSPIRRWADVVNQNTLLSIFVGEPYLRFMKDCGTLNKAAKCAKAVERDLFFVRRLLGPGGCAPTEGVVLRLDPEANKARVWVESWQRIVRIKAPVGVTWPSLRPGQRVILAVFCDMGKRNWKRRMVMRLSV